MDIIKKDENGIKKYYRGNKVAVIISPGYGCGWFSEHPAGEDYKEHPLFSPTIVQLILDHQIGYKSDNFISNFTSELERIFPNAYFDGLNDAYIEWIPVGTYIRIANYDGAETLIKYHEDNYEKV